MKVKFPTIFKILDTDKISIDPNICMVSYYIENKYDLRPNLK